jgi:hypothetical protein
VSAAISVLFVEDKGNEEAAMRAFIVVGLAAGLLALAGGKPGHAGYYEGPWCLKANMGQGHVVERCHFRSFEHCERELQLWGSTSFCIQSHRYPPHWYGRGFDPPQRAVTRKKPRRR